MSATVILVILVPLVLFAWLVGQAMPTPRDRQLERLRTRARELDLHVTLRMAPDPDPEPEQRVSSAGVPRDPRLELAAYALPVRLPRDVPTPHALHWRVARMRQHVDEIYVEGLAPGWRLDRADLPLQADVLVALSALIDRCPRGTVTVEGSPRDVTLCWRERGEVEEVDHLRTLLGDLAAFQTGLARAAAGLEAEREALPDSDD